MKIMLIILIGLIFILSFFILKLFNDLRSLNKQTSIKLNKDSNFTITSDLNIDVFNQLCENLNLMYDKYSDANRSRNKSEEEFKEMLSYIAHDIRTPLTSVQGFMQLLQEQDRNLENKRYYEIINVRLSDVKNILEQFFLYSKLINDDYKLKQSECNVYDICCQSLANFYQQLMTNEIEPRIEFEQHMMIVYGNKELLTKVFDNLISNSLKHGNGDLTIIQHTNEIKISNSIKKAAEIDLDKVFERFYKADTSRSNVSSGLGLTIVQKAIHLMGGDVIASIEDYKFCVTIKLDEQNHI
ncbi:MAG: HAMP domain-containing histidine kinase [Erysipelotrichia bacterium]|nr:HAMP domain-containing histidine kinase [Erysipelotrichia bacterium]NCC54915.1 HAMP domain-containing histidine kinase [Erysipelotrichia bacterium]